MLYVFLGKEIKTKKSQQTKNGSLNNVSGLQVITLMVKQEIKEQKNLTFKREERSNERNLYTADCFLTG